MAKSLDFLIGKTTDELVSFNDFLVHKEMFSDLSRMFYAAKTDGIDFGLMSSYRSYELQKTIWNEKVLGQRAVLDSDSRPVDISTKTNEELLFLIMRWSAIPGGSRHHWGSDMDVFDKAKKPADYQVQLIPREYEEGGYFYESSLWLNEFMDDFNFFRPYSKDTGGIAPEPWHLSYRPLAEKFLKDFTLKRFTEHLNTADFQLVNIARSRANELYERFIMIPK
jgi:LAS superfamily LD-carboxypeptidase LdcB